MMRSVSFHFSYAATILGFDLNQIRNWPHLSMAPKLEPFRKGRMWRVQIIQPNGSLRYFGITDLPAEWSRQVYHPADPAFKPSLSQRQSPQPGNAILRDRDKGL
jgi:hypothetical protein